MRGRAMEKFISASVGIAMGSVTFFALGLGSFPLSLGLIGGLAMGIWLMSEKKETTQ